MKDLKEILRLKFEKLKNYQIDIDDLEDDVNDLMDKAYEEISPETYALIVLSMVFGHIIGRLLL